jgi:hypothetical protein
MDHYWLKNLSWFALIFNDSDCMSVLTMYIDGLFMQSSSLIIEDLMLLDSCCTIFFISRWT